MLVQVDGSDGHFLTGTAFCFVRRARGAQDAEGLVQQITELVHDFGPDSGILVEIVYFNQNIHVFFVKIFKCRMDGFGRVEPGNLVRRQRVRFLDGLLDDKCHHLSLPASMTTAHKSMRLTLSPPA